MLPVLSWPRGFVPSEIGTMLVLLLNALMHSHAAYRYIRKPMNGVFSGFRASPLCRQGPLRWHPVLILWVCNTRSISLLGTRLVSFLLWNPWSLWPLIFHIFGFSSDTFSSHLTEINGHEDNEGSKGDSLITRMWWVSNIWEKEVRQVFFSSLNVVI